MWQQMDDWQLLEDFRERGSQQAFARLVERHAGLVYHACRRRLRDAHLAEDVAQAVFVLLSGRGPARSEHPTLAGWLYRTAHHACANAARARSRRAKHELIAAQQRQMHSNDREADVNDALLEEGMAQLGPADRDMLIMRFYEDRELDELAATLEISANTAAKRLSRAVGRLRKIFASRGHHISATLIGPMLTGALRQPAPDGLVSQMTAAAMTESVQPVVESIVKGVIQMMTQTKLKLAAATMGMVVMGGAMIGVTVLLAQAPDAKHQATSATQPTAPADPKGILKQFAAAVRAGDAQKLRSLSLVSNDSDQQLVDAGMAFVTSSGEFRKAVAARFGKEADRELASLIELTPLGRFTLFIETTVDQAPETIDGDLAIIQPPDIDDLTFYLVKDNGQWKLSVTRMIEAWTPEQLQDRIGLMQMAAQAMQQFGERIEAGKYATFAELKRDIAPVMRQNR